MQTKSTFKKLHYKRLVLLSFVYFMALCLGYALLLFHQGPRVRHFLYNPTVYRKSIIVTFDRPLKQNRTVEPYISINPKVSFSAAQTANQITISINQNLASDTSYTVTIKPGIQDGRRVYSQQSYTKVIKRPPASYTYLNRVYTCLEATQGKPCKDQIIEQGVGSSKRTILAEAVHIKSFDRNRDYLVVLRGVSKTADALFVINLHNKKHTEVSLGGRVMVSKIGMSPSLPVVTFMAYGDSAQSLSTFQSYDIRSKRFITIKPPGNPDNGVSDFFYSHDGSALLYQDFNSVYYVTDPMTPGYKPTLIGSYADSGGFNYNDSKLLFQDAANGIFIYDALNKSKQPVRLTETAPKFNFASNSDAIIAQAFVLGNGSSVSTNLVRQAGDATTILYHLNDQTNLVGYALSPDDRYILIQTSDRNVRTLDDATSYSGFAQATTNRVILYDTVTKKTMTTTSGSKAVWLQ